MAGIRQEVFSVRSPIVNAYIVRGERAIIIDTGIPGFGEKILAKMEEHGIKPADVSLILITHGHHDHYGSVAFLREKTGAPVAIHKEDAGSLRTGINPPLYPVGVRGKIRTYGRLCHRAAGGGLCPAGGHDLRRPAAQAYPELSLFLPGQGAASQKHTAHTG